MAGANYREIIQQRCPFEVWFEEYEGDTLVQLRHNGHGMIFRLTPQSLYFAPDVMADIVLREVYAAIDTARVLEEVAAVPALPI